MPRMADRRPATTPPRTAGLTLLGFMDSSLAQVGYWLLATRPMNEQLLHRGHHGRNKIKCGNGTKKAAGDGP